jgi:hypothetical protein
MAMEFHVVIFYSKGKCNMFLQNMVACACLITHCYGPEHTVQCLVAGTEGNHKKHQTG